jgi:hypothetical protein
LIYEWFDAALGEAGCIAMGGQIIDASLIAAPKQRNTEDEKAAIRDGRIYWAARGGISNSINAIADGVITTFRKLQSAEPPACRESFDPAWTRHKPMEPR